MQHGESSSVRPGNQINAASLLTPSTRRGGGKQRFQEIVPARQPSRWSRTVLLTSIPTGALGHELESTHVVAGAVEIVATVHGDVQRVHLAPAVRRARLGEVAWRAEGRGQNARLLFRHAAKRKQDPSVGPRNQVRGREESSPQRRAGCPSHPCYALRYAETFATMRSSQLLGGRNSLSPVFFSYSLPLNGCLGDHDALWKVGDPPSGS